MLPSFSDGRHRAGSASPGATIDLVDRYLNGIDRYLNNRAGIAGPGRCARRRTPGVGDVSASGSYCYSKMSGI
jgi:hypothetical protein